MKKKPAMQVSASSFDGAATLCVVGSFTKEDGELLQMMLDHMVAEIKQFGEGIDEGGADAGDQAERW